jgi:hypothetical protein
MAMTGEIRVIPESRIVRIATAVAHWGRRRSVRRDISELYRDDEERRATLEEQLLLDRERRAAQLELDRAVAQTAMFRAF